MLAKKKAVKKVALAKESKVAKPETKKIGKNEPTAPSPALQYAYSSVTYTTSLNGVSDCEWIIPGTIEQREKTRAKINRYKLERSNPTVHAHGRANIWGNNDQSIWGE